MLIRITTLALLLTAAPMLVGCQSTQTAQTEENCVPAPAGGNRPGKLAVNTVCPIMSSDAADETVTVTHKGKVIAFCCGGCVKKFNAMDAAGKDAILAKAMTYAN